MDGAKKKEFEAYLKAMPKECKKEIAMFQIFGINEGWKQKQKDELLMDVQWLRVSANNMESPTLKFLINRIADSIASWVEAICKMDLGEVLKEMIEEKRRAGCK